MDSLLTIQTSKGAKQFVAGGAPLAEGLKHHCVAMRTVKIMERNPTQSDAIGNQPFQNSKIIYHQEEMIMDASTAIKKFGLEQAFHYMYKDP